MRTIIINTSEASVNTKLDILFRAPFDTKALLYYTGKLVSIGDFADKIKQDIINDTDTVDRDYNLIVLVDLYEFPRGNEQSAAKAYKALVTEYISVNLIKKLNNEFNILPSGSLIYYVHTTKKINNWSSDLLVDLNPEEQEAREYEELLKQEKLREAQAKSRKLSDKYHGMPEEFVSRTAEERLFMELFGWDETIRKDSFKWNLKISVSNDDILDFSNVFATTASDIKNSSSNAKVLDIALRMLDEVSNVSLGDWDSAARVMPSYLSGYNIICKTIKFDRDNEQNFIEGFFNVLANIFRCVQANDVALDTKIYSSDEIKQILISALKKYSHFSNENNIALEFEPIKTIFDKRDKIFAKRNDDANVSAGIQDSIKYAENLINKKSAESENDEHSEGTYEIDRRFYDLVAEIFANYDPKVIEKQNAEIVKDCFEGLWTWRDKQTREDFKNTVDAFLETQTGNYNSKVRENLTFVDAECEKEYYEIFNEITDAEYHLCANKNILLDVKNLIFEYGRLMRKGKWYLMSFIGAIVTIFITVFPYVYIEYNSGNSGLPFYAAALLYVALFAFLYGVASSIYIYKIHKRKNVLVTELEELKQQSEKDRIESIAMLYKYYKETVVKAENFSLLLHEIFRRDRENAKKGVKRNNHIKHLELLIGEVKRFMTMLKYDCNDSACKVTSEDIKDYSSKNLCLNAEESFHSEDNRRIYSIFTEDENQEKGE